MLEKHRELLEVNSFRFNPGGIDKTGSIISQWFEQLNFESKLIQSTIEGAGHHLVLSKKGSSKRNLIYIAHLDTVYPEENSGTESFPVRTEGNRLYGPGAADCKGGIALFWLIMKVLQKTLPKTYDKFSCSFLLNATEEGGCADFPELLRQHINAHTIASIGLEPGIYIKETGIESGFVTARKGSRRFLLEIEGREAHSGTNHPYGVNAIREIARKIEEAAKLTDYKKGITVNVGTVSGGTSVNTVPKYAKAEIDIRYEHSEDIGPVAAQLMELCSQPTISSPVDNFSTRLNLTEQFGYPAWPGKENHQDFINQIVAGGQEIGIKLVPRISGGGSDSAYMAELIPTVDSLGPVGGNFHIKNEEFLLLDSIPSRALLHIVLINKLI